SDTIFESKPCLTHILLDGCGTPDGVPRAISVLLRLLQLEDRVAVVIDHRLLHRPQMRRRLLEDVEVDLDVLTSAVLRVRHELQDAAGCGLRSQREHDAGDRRIRNAELLGQRLHRVRLTVDCRVDDLHGHEYLSQRSMPTRLVEGRQQRDRRLANSVRIEQLLRARTTRLSGTSYRYVFPSHGNSM